MSFIAYSSVTVTDMSSSLILSVDVWYYLSTSNKTLTGGTWQTLPPAWEENKYYWQKTITTYNNNTTTETKPVCITGGIGQPGTGIEKIVEEYAISDRKDIAPETGWKEVSPKWEYGKYIWSRTKIVYKNPTSIAYTTPICDSAWEAIDGIQVGGRNLILNSTFKDYKNNGIYTFNNDEVIFSINTFTNGNNSSPDKYRVSFSMSNEFVKNVRGKTITISMDYYVEKAITYGATEPYIGIAISLFRNDNTGGSTEYFNWYGNNTFPKNVTGKWIRYSRTVSVSDYDISSYGIYIYMRDATGTVKFRHPKIEFGNKATDWTPAPEDAEQQFNTITNTLSGVESVVNKLDRTITDKVWQDDITTTINNYDGTVTESLRNRVTETEKNINGITSTVKDMETTVSKKADGSTVETLNTRLTKAEQDANGFKTTVEDYFSTTDKTLNGIQSWRTEVNQKISKDGILSTVGSYYVSQEELNNLNIGGNNLVNKEDVQFLPDTVVQITDYTFDISGTSHNEDGNYRGVFIPETVFTVGEFYVFSYKFTIKSGSVTKIGGHSAAFQTVKAVVDGAEYDTEYDVGYPLDSKKTEHTVVVYLKYHGIGDDKKLYIQPNRQWGTNGEWNILLSNIQVEKGNMKTDWSPSYKDMMNDIQIGARNLIVNSSFEKQKEGWITGYSYGTTFPEEGIDGKRCAKVTGVLRTTCSLYSDTWYAAKPGETYTLSGWSKSKDIVEGTTNYFISLYVGFYDKNDTYKSEVKLQNGKMTLNAEWTHHALTFTVPDISGIERMWVYLYARDFTGTIWWDNIKLEKGNKATDWTPAPEDTEKYIENVETIANQTKEKFTWLVKSGTSSTNFELTDRTATLVANSINLKGLVTFSGLSTDTQSKINSSSNWTSSNGSNMLKMLDMVKTWTNGALSTTTTINGGYIKTNTINASHLTLGDFTNLVDVNESLSQSTIPERTHPFSIGSEPTISGGYITKKVATAKYVALSSYKPNSFSDGDEIYYEFTARRATVGKCYIGIWFYGDGTPGNQDYQIGYFGTVQNFTTSDATYSGVIKLRNVKQYGFYAIGINDDNQDAWSQIYMKNISVRKKTNSTLIVDGSILGKHVAANAIDASKIQIGNLNNICVVNPDTYNPYGATIVTSHGEKHFRLGDTTPRFIQLILRDKISANTYYPVGDSWKFRAYGHQTVSNVNNTFCIRVYYTDNTFTNLATCHVVAPAPNPGYFEGQCKITNKPTAGKSISHFTMFIETTNAAAYYLYLRDITIYPMSNTILLEDGCVTTPKITTENITGTNGWINLRSGTFNYGNGKFSWNGSVLTVNGSGSFSGTITSSAGTIGGWSITSSCIYRGNGYNVANGMYFGTSGLSVSNKFKVDANGNVTMTGATMTSANVSGTITSSAGTIGGWSITSSCIYRGSSDYNSTTGMYFGTSGLRLGSSFKVNNTGYATINGGTFTGTINAETGKISGWRLLSSRLISLDVDIQNETDFTNKGTKAVYLAKYNYNNQGSISAIGIQTRVSTSNAWVNRIDIRYDGSMVFKNQSDVIVTKFENGNWSDISTISCNDVIVKQNSKSYKLSHRMLVCDDTTNVLGVGMTTSGDRLVPMKDKKADYAHGKIAIGSNQNRFSEIWSVKALNTSSDRNLKTNISSFDERFESFFMDLNTCTFMYKNFTYDDTHDRLHWGIDAQQAEQALIKNNITISEAGFLCIDNLEYPNAAGQMKEYSVRYSELIGLDIHMTQKNHERIKELEKQNQELEKRIALLEECLK